MSSLHVLLALVLMATVSIHSAVSIPRCASCEGDECNPPKLCSYGIVKDYCGRDVCAKGPGQRCGGKWNYHGSCGDGMFCSCGRCTGCSLRTLECFSQTCI